MQPVPETREVRRTVRVAVALVVGQALLCAVIGWVTFSYSRERAHRDPAAVDQLAAPPATIAVSPSVPTTGRTPGPTPGSSRARSTPPAAPVPPGPPRPATGVTTSTGPAASVAPTTTSKSPYLVVIPPPAAPRASASPSPAASATPTAVVEEPVVAGARCDRRGALGRTADGVDVLCLPDRQGRLHWKIV